MKITESFTLFFSAADPLSNWHPSPFAYRDRQFQCVEQFMMYSKAMLFGDEGTARKILESNDPKQQKALGRAVKNFDESTWNAKRLNIVAVGCREKFAQNPKLLHALMSTGDTVLVEASPYDRIWGIGLSKDDPRALDPSQWLGQNLLGATLMRVREQFAAIATKAFQQAPKQAPRRRP